MVELVNLRFIADHYGVPPERVLELRSKGHGILAVHDHARRVAQGHRSGKRPG
ncbi:MAG: hypothetical protein HY704_11905 [Gemmatimonadetes bacterium]|nr:hypothetical protein [Gemmatimonadota bacterium]